MKSIRLLFCAGLWAVAAVVAAETVTGSVVAIADGDTITVLQDEVPVKVRLHGVDTPESKQDFGTAARAFTADFCFGQDVTVVVTDTDRYGRKVGVVVRGDGRVLNHELVAAGMAHWYERYATADVVLERLQAEAKAARRGVWSRPDVIAPWDFRQGKRNGNGIAAPYNPPMKDTNEPAAAVQWPEQAGPQTVYVTETGSKFHRSGCRALASSKKAMARAEAELRFAPCGICTP